MTHAKGEDPHRARFLIGRGSIPGEDSAKDRVLADAGLCALEHANGEEGKHWARPHHRGRGLLEDYGCQSLGREVRHVPRTRVHIGRGPLLGEDPSADPGPSVAGLYFLGLIDGDVHTVGEDDPGDRSFP